MAASFFLTFPALGVTPSRGPLPIVCERRGSTQETTFISDDTVVILGDSCKGRRHLPAKRADCRLGGICLAVHSSSAMLLLLSTVARLIKRGDLSLSGILDAVAKMILQSQKIASSTDVQVNSNDACAELMSCS